jgi:hypothetical protein
METEVEISCTRDAFAVSARLSASEDDRRVFERRWDESADRSGI